MSETSAISPADHWQALFVFQCKGIQPFVLGSDKLKDMVGATEIVSQLPERTLNEVLKHLGLESSCYAISQAAGSARLLFRSLDDAQKLARIWPMVCAHAAPGMEAVHTVQRIVANDYLHAVNEAERALVRKRNRPAANLPEIMPPVRRANRTGQAAVDRLSDGEYLDAATVVKHRVRRDERQDSREPDKFPDIYRRFALEDTVENRKRVPGMMEHISGNNRAFVAVLHADGNGMGKMFVELEAELKKLPALDAPSFYKALSNGIIEVGDKAAQAALLSVRPQLDEAANKDDFWPFLPIVLAGDDLTVVLRADMAVPFAKTFLQAFECESRALFQRLLANDHFKASADILRPSLGPCFTAGAGIAFVKARYPFAQAYHLSESLAGFAKRMAKEHRRADDLPPSTLAFHKVTGDVVRESFDDLRDGELKSKVTGIRLSLAPCVVGENAASGPPLPSLAQLETLAEAASKVPRGQVRELLRLLREDLAGAIKHYQRFREQATKEAEPNRKAFADALDALLGTSGGKLHDDDKATPLQDAWTLCGFSAREKDDL